MTKKQAYRNTQWLLLIIYLVGVVGLSLGAYRDDFNKLTPLNLWISSGILLYFSEKTNLRYYGWVFFVAIAGFFVEMLGVKTGFPFGSYSYGAALGYKVNDIPLTIGLNWMVLILGVLSISKKTKLSPFLQSVLAACLMVAIDFLIEPVAIKLDFWSWEGNIPISNYLAWWGISFCLTYSYFLFKIKVENKMAAYLFAIQLIFFLTLNFTL